ncbi:MAG: amylo-alpha-1,6-glucosidase [Hungatella sp.]
MKWIYGRQEFGTIERSQENCYLLTNGLGGFSSLTAAGSASRNDHALLMTCTKAPNHRYNMVHRLSEQLILGEEAEEPAKESFWLSTQEFADGHMENGFEQLSAFVFEDGPVWKFQVQGVEIRKEIGMKQQENTVAVRYEICNRSRRTAALEVVPYFQFTRKGEDLEKGQTFEIGISELQGYQITSQDMSLFFDTDGVVTETQEQKETYFYRYDVCDGRRETGTAKASHKIVLEVTAGETKALKLVYSMENARQDADDIIQEMKDYRRSLENAAGLELPMARELVKSAGQFVSKRESTRGSTILAGYPFFEDWGRDTMIALPGICISSRQYDAAKDILRTFALHEYHGLMPNLFPEGENEPLYNTADAALLFINCVYLYYQASDDLAFVKEMYPVMERIMEGYRKGTDYGIYMDTDGLIHSGEDLWQVTWMDVRIGDVLPTPRHGKPVEINAYWYNALCVMEQFASLIGKTWKQGGLKEQVRTSFVEQFWMEEKHCLKDLVSGTDADEQIRCNQIWAVSMPFTMLEREQERQVTETVFEKLYTPYGLRTLEESDPEFHPVYTGPMEERDMAYHQGTVWTFPLGAYYLAYLKVHGYSQEVKQRVLNQLEVMEAAMREGCIGQLPEIYDGKSSTRSKGCFAQAWSTGEILRVYEAIERG